MKFYIKRLFLAFIFIVIVVIFWHLLNRLDDKEENILQSRKEKIVDEDEDVIDQKPGKSYLGIDCLINDEYSVSCIKSDDDNAVFIPFAFIRKYFEIDGKITKRKDGREVFSWHHSYSKVIYPHEAYNHKGVYLWFDNYNVEVRDRVKCISAIDGVPISIQWQPKGHFYPIQIAQFGLSHWSKNLTSGRPRITDLENGEAFNKRMVQYLVPTGATLKRVAGDDQTPANKVLLVDGNNIVMKLKRKSSSDLTLNFEVKPLGNFSLTAILKSEVNSLEEFKVTYLTTDHVISAFKNEVVYGIGTDEKWKSLTRDLAVDIQKGFTLSDHKLPVKARNLHLMRFEFNGKAYLDNIKVSSSAHEVYSKIAGEWLLNNQDEIGGWPIKVTRKLSNGLLTLKPGWYSAMAQGQAISLLVRLYHSTGDNKYLNAAMKAVNIFKIDSSHGGVRAFFFDKLVWYEEYPTIPSSFVLNGFVYSLFGLYDLKMSCFESSCQNAAQLFDDGINSLKQMLMFYDSGFGTFYDLRHFSLGTAPNLARWDYHTTHINQLLYLNSISNHLLFQATAKRWISYLKGKHAPHN